GAMPVSASIRTLTGPEPSSPTRIAAEPVELTLIMRTSRTSTSAASRVPALAVAAAAVVNGIGGGTVADPRTVTVAGEITGCPSTRARTPARRTELPEKTRLELSERARIDAAPSAT